MADKRAYFKMDVGYLMNPKIARVAAERPSAVLLHIAAMAYSAQHLTDGVVPTALVMRLAGSDEGDLQALLEARLLHEVEGGCVEVHDYLEHQRSAESVKAQIEGGKRGGQKARSNDKRRKASTDPSSKGSSLASTEASTEREERESNNVRDSEEPRREDVEELCGLLSELLKRNGVKRWKTTQRWRDAARLLLDRDERPLPEALAVVRWCQGNTFWQGVVLSMPTFREKYDQLRLQAQSAGELGNFRHADPVEWLRECWTRGDAASVSRETGVRYEPPDLPLDEHDPEAFFLRDRKAWIERNHEMFLAKLSEGRAA